MRIAAGIILIGITLGGCQMFQRGADGGLPSKTKIKIADKLFEEQFFYDAVEYYSAIVDEQPNNVDVINKLAESYFYSRDYKNAEMHYHTVVENTYKAVNFYFPKARYQYGLTLKMNQKYDQAKEQFEQFMNEYKGDDKRTYKIKVENEIAGCDMARGIIAKPLSVLVVHMGSEINAAYTEAAPFPFGDSVLIYSSLRSDTVIVSEDGKFKQAKFRLYKSVKENKKWKQGELLPDKINQKKVNVANGTFSPDFKNFYFTICDDNDAGKLVCAIYRSEYENGKWKNIEKLDEMVNVKDFTSTHPTIAISKRGNQILYFASDMPGGLGGLDIWYSEITKTGTVRKPRNLGKKINTVSDELTPFYNNNSRILYFSSNGHPAIGGYDVFTSEGRMRKWTSPENVGYPLNSSVDDMYFVADADEEGGYFVSNRKGSIALKSETCCDDIYRYTWDRNLIPKIAIDGFAFDEDKTISSFEDRSKVKLQLLRAWGDTVRTTVINENNFFVYEELPSLEKYLFALDMNEIELDGDKTYNPRLTLLNSSGASISSVVLNKDGFFVFENLPMIKNYLFAVDVLEEVSIQLYLVDRDSSEILINEMVTVKGDPFYFPLKQNKNYKIVATKEGFFTNYITFSTMGMTKSDTLHRNLPLKKLELNKAIVLKDIYYDFDKSSLRPESNKTLKLLVQILNENPAIVVELGAHTDSKGEDLYNQKLSQKRAESVVKYLRKAGISRTRLRAKGYGETQFIAANINEDGSDNPEGRQLNRRTEVKVVGKTKVKLSKKKVTAEDAFIDAEEDE